MGLARVRVRRQPIGRWRVRRSTRFYIGIICIIVGLSITLWQMLNGLVLW